MKQTTRPYAIQIWFSPSEFESIQMIRLGDEYAIHAAELSRAAKIVESWIKEGWEKEKA